MKKTILKRSALRDIKGSKGRYFAILSIIALGVGFFTGVKITTPAMVSMMNSFLTEKQLYDLRLVSTVGWDDESIESMSQGQYEAAEVLGYTKSQTFLRVILPQVVKRIMPSVTNEVITLVKDTSLAFTLAYQEVFSLAKQISASQTSFIPFVIAGVFYFIANYAVEFATGRIEKSLDYYR